MTNYNPMLLCDFYKCTHNRQYPKGITRLVAYYTPRMSRLEDVDQVLFWRLQAFMKEYLVDGFNQYFFCRNKSEVMNEYKNFMTSALGVDSYDADKIEALHDLGYLPLEIRAVPEGSRTKVGVPQIEITNTHPSFAWVVNSIETLLSCSMWHAQIAAEVGIRYRHICQKYADLTCAPGHPVASLLGDFSMRGQHSLESATVASAGWLLSFRNTSCVPSIMWLHDHYAPGMDYGAIGKGAISTEHSVMCSNYAIDGDEITMIKRLLTDIYPNHSFSMVSDSYDYWNLVNSLLPQCRTEIMTHNGTLLIRGDSGDPVQVVTQTVYQLMKHFGYTVNEKGFKVLPVKIKAIYGDSITPQRLEAIYKDLYEHNCSIENVVLGVGSFSFMCLETFDEDGNAHYNPYTRDTFGVAVKTTYGENVDGNPIMIFKNPKECSFKKSQKGCCVVAPDGQSYTDGHTLGVAHSEENNLLQQVFYNGKITRYYLLDDIRQRMWGKF